MDETNIRITVYRDEMSLRTAGIAGLAPVASPPLPDRLVVFRIGHPAAPSKVAERGESVPGTEEQRHRWMAAERTYLDTVSEALNELHRAHGDRNRRVDLYRDNWARWEWSRLRGSRWDVAYGLYRLGQWWSAEWDAFNRPGRGRRGATRSAKARRAFLARVERAGEAYRPVREEIEPLFAASRTEREAAEQAAARRRETLRRVAARRQWSYLRRDDGSTVDVRLSGDLTTDPSSSSPTPLTARQLEDALLKLARDARLRLAWAADARAAIQRQCAEAGVRISFDR